MLHFRWLNSGINLIMNPVLTFWVHEVRADKAARCFVSYAVNLWWLCKCADQTPAARSRLKISATTHANYTATHQHPDVAAMETIVANPPIMSGQQLSNARHAARLVELSAGQSAAPTPSLSLNPVVCPLPPLVSMTYARARNDLIWRRNVISLQLLCKYFTS